jgi:NADH dehydrogenase
MGPRQVTVFGASGFIGRHVVRRLAADGARVVAAVRDPVAADFLRPMGDVGQIAPLACDVRNPHLVARALRGSDAAVNLVGILFESRRIRFDAIHGEAPGVIARAAAAAGVEALVHISAIGADPAADSNYARSKGAGEAALRAGFPDAVILRPSIVFGPEDDFFNRFAALARISPVLPLFGGGTTRFQPVYVCDVAEAVVRGLTRHDLRGRTFELGGPHIRTFRELLEDILEVTGRQRGLLPLPMALADLIGYAGDVIAWFGIEPMLTRDQARQLRRDNVASGDGFDAMGIRPTAMEVVLPAYLDRFRKAGRFRPSRI